MMDSTFSRFALRLVLAALPFAGAAHAALSLNHDTTVGPLPKGRFAVACSNIEQDASRIATGASASDYWEGRAVNGVDHYVTELLVNPAATLTFDADIPDVRRLYVGHAGDKVTFTAIACFPTSQQNTDPDYVLPETGDVIPHMQPAGTAPKLITLAEYSEAFGLHFDPRPLFPAKLPTILFSHGLTGSPLGSGYIDVLKELAAQGYFVAAPFHGDQRFSRVRVQDFNDLVYLFRDLDRVVEMQLMRPLSLKAMTDVLLANPGFAPAIDTDRIGAFGASMGGEAVALLTGAKMTTSWDLDCDASVQDPRVKAAVGYVPYAGQIFLPAFCAGQGGASGVNRPYLAISGTSDTTAPLPLALLAAQRFSSSRYLVALVGGQHELRPEDAPAVLTWTITFLNAYLGVPQDPAAMARFIKMKAVNVGREQQMLLDVHVPFASTIGQRPAIEFFNTTTRHYFMTSEPGDVAIIESGAVGPNWERTGQGFNVWPVSAAAAATADGAAPVCRFYAPGPNSHFYTASAAECELVQHFPGWILEGTVFYARPTDANGQCPPGYLGVMRAYNNRFAYNDSNHRYSTSDSTMRGMVLDGWLFEGTVMCVRP